MAQWFWAYDDHDHKVNAGVLGGAEWNFFFDDRQVLTCGIFFNAGVLGGAEWNYFFGDRQVLTCQKQRKKKGV